MSDDCFTRNRVILCHFDSYSTALVFARYGASILAPEPLPEGAAALAAPAEAGAEYDPATALQTLVTRYGLDASSLKLEPGFQEWAGDAAAPIRIHLARFTTFEAPRDAMEPNGAVFKPISEMRGLPAAELNFLRRVFNLIMGGS